MDEKTRVHIFVSGRVQGVFFRQDAYKEAGRLGIFGWIQNLPDGRVEAIFEGEKEAIGKMISWAREGPISAKVDDFKADYEEYKDDFKNFEVR